MVLDLITMTNHNKFIIFADSLSALTALKIKNVTDPLTTQVLNRVYHLSRSKEIIFRWIPSHLGIPGNDRADSEAKKALKDSIAPTKIPYTNYESVVNKSIFKKWQDHWDTHTNNKLHSIKPTIGEWNINTRLHIGHTYITHHLLKGSESPIYSICKKRLTVKHILL